MKYNDQVRSATVAIFKRYIKKEIDSGIDATNLDQIMMNIESSDQFTLDLMASLDCQQREASAEGIAVAKAADIVARSEGRFEDVKYKGRKSSVCIGDLRAAILATSAYSNLDTQTDAVNREYMKVSRSRLYKEKAIMKGEGLL